jgi:hypothetical protein
MPTPKRTPAQPCPPSTCKDSYVVLTGAGKSGSKRVLKLFDLSPQTHCRCEPNEVPGSPLAEMPGRRSLQADSAEHLDATWDDAITTTAERISGRDRQPTPPKHHLWRWSRRLQLYRLIKHRKLRRLLGREMASPQGAEWQFPRWLGDRCALARATPVLKISMAPGWIAWLLQHRPNARVVNIVRHPGAYLHSHIGRWLKVADPEDNRRRNRDRLHAVAHHDPQWTGPTQRIDSMCAIESELWYWRYVYESLHAPGSKRSNYLLLRDEEVVADPGAAAKRLYAFAGLDCAAALTTYVAKMAPHWQDRTAPWRQLLEDDHVALVERVLAGSELETWWEPNQVVSLFDYVAY